VGFVEIMIVSGAIYKRKPVALAARMVRKCLRRIDQQVVRYMHHENW
jgi:hypothetical protein